MVDESRDAELGFMRQLLSRFESEANRARWRRAMRRRSTRISRGLHVVRTAYDAAKITWNNGDGARRLFIDGALAVTVRTATSGRTIAELDAALPVELHRPPTREDLVTRLVLDGSIVIEKKY